MPRCLRYLTALFFLVFITISTFMMLSLFVGVITTSMGAAAVKQTAAMKTKTRIKACQVRDGSPLPHLRRDWAHRRDICAGTGLIPPRSAPGLGSAVPSAPGLGSAVHICTGTGVCPCSHVPAVTAALKPMGRALARLAAT